MDITQVDPLREINPPPRVAQRDIPWDDPYPFYVQMIPPAEEVEESPTFSRLSGGSRSGAKLTLIILLSPFSHRQAAVMPPVGAMTAFEAFLVMPLLSNITMP